MAAGEMMLGAARNGSMIVGMIIGAASNGKTIPGTGTASNGMMTAATPGTASGMAASNGRTAPGAASNGKTHILKPSKARNGTAGFGWLSPASPHMRVTETLVGNLKAPPGAS